MAVAVTRMLRALNTVSNYQRLLANSQGSGIRKYTILKWDFPRNLSTETPVRLPRIRRILRL
jgi:hypothetical protein